MSTARVDFTRGAAERIARVVRLVEQGDRDESPLSFRKIDPPASSNPIRLGTFTGAWAKGEDRTITVVGGTATYLVRNATLPIDVDDQSPNTASRYVLFSRANGTNHAIEIEQGGLCGSWKEYLITLSVANCSGTGASARVTMVSTGTTPAPVSNSGPGPINTIQMISGGSNYAQRGRQEPVLDVAAQSSNVSFSVSYEQLTGTCDLPYWRISSISASGDTTYWTPQQLTVSPQSSVTEIVPAVLNLNTAGATIVDPGAYYKESNALPVYTHDITVSVQQDLPSAGTGATFITSVDTNPASPTFGQVTAVTIDDGGGGYVAWKWNGSIPFAGGDFAKLPDFNAYEKQVLGHDGSCLKWFSVTTCAANP